MSARRGALRALVGPFFIAAGTLHFARPRMYEAIMPPYLPAPRAMVYASGVAEIAGGVGLAAGDPRLRRMGGWLTIATLAAVFPANLHMYLHASDYHRVPGGRRALAARLPLQLAFVAWAVAGMRR